MSGEIPPDPLLLSMASNAMTNKIDSILSSINFDTASNNNSTETNDNNTNKNKTQLTEKEKKEKQEILNNMKNDIKKFTNVFIGNSTKKVHKILKTEIFTIQITSNNPNDTESNNKKAIEERISIANFTDCENILKKENNISQTTVLLLKKVEFDAKMDIDRAKNPDASPGLSFEFIDPTTMKKLDAKVCSEIKTPMKIPFKRGERLKMKIYQKSVLINKGLDLYNKESPAYYSRCIKSNQIDTGADVSINYKRNKMFQNTTITCSPGCEYEGLDENKYVKCNCKTNGDKESSNNGNEFTFDPLPSMNYDIVLCYYETYIDVRIFYDFIFFNSLRKI